MYDLYFFKKGMKYPSPEEFFNPELMYPEYPWPQDSCSKINEVYSAIRETLFGIGLDRDNFGSPSWNPLGSIICPGDVVLLKPNWVSHKNNNHKADLDCLITHTSIIRAIIDYCIIALKGTGKLIIGDAPIQAADLGLLFYNNHINDLLGFYRQKNVKIDIYDFRLLQAFGKNGVWHRKAEVNSKNEAINVDLGEKSEFYLIEKEKRKYHVMDYHTKKTTQYHGCGKHAYSINKNVLEADVIINLPKPKCHKLAGITGALKNIVGIVADKACLPHDSLGSQSSGGDAYPDRNYLKAASVKVRELKANFEDKGYYAPALITRYIDLGIRLLIKLFCMNQIQFGSWHGNDTIWRTILDLNKILKYSDKNGIMKNTIQRKQFHIADMVVSGEKDGPLSPSPKEIGVIIAGFNAEHVDSLIAKYMGFDLNKIPSIIKAIEQVENEKPLTKIEMGSNDPLYCDTIFSELKFPEDLKFKPHPCWEGYIEA